MSQQGASPQHYPISQFLLRLLEETQLDRSGFVLSLGYRNLERGRRRLDAWIDRGEGYRRILKQIAVTHPGNADRLLTALMNTTAIKTAEADAAFLESCKAEAPTFVPFVHAEGEARTPNGITIFGVTGGHRRWTTIEIPQSILELPLAAQLAALPNLMTEYKRRYNGCCPFFGKLVGFKFVRLVDHFQFDSAGQLVEHIDKPYRQGQVSVSLR